MKLFFFCVAILTIAIYGNVLHAQVPQRPNIIFILSDDIGYDVPTVNGGQSFSTPNIDSMARNGMNFSHCESTPMCSPSRMLLLTGKQNFRNYHTWGYMVDTVKTIGSMMQDAGYKTAFFGKAQLQLNQDPNQMQRWGWDAFTIFEIMDDLGQERRYKSPTLMDNNGWLPDSITKNKYCDDILTRRVGDFAEKNKNNPFFIYYSMSLCHAPFTPTPDDPQYESWDPVQGQPINDPSYFPSMVKYMDKKVGEILSRLRNAGLDSNTLVLFAGDNGTPVVVSYYANGIQVKGGKSYTNERGTNVPLMAYMPGYVAPNTKNDDLIDFTDFFRTFAGAGQRSNLSQYGALDGVSFYNRLFGLQTDSVRSHIFSHYAPYRETKKDTLARWVRDKVYKLYDSTLYKQSGKFYNIAKDPNEKKPILDKQLTAIEKEIKASFKKILETTPGWDSAPRLTNIYVTDRTNNAATIHTTIFNTGASALLERGTNLSKDETAYYFDGNKKDSVVALGYFTHLRTKLKPQTAYQYSSYGRNKNEGHSIGYYWGTFYTLSNPPKKQATSFTATPAACTINLSWNAAIFPSGGASYGGYLVLYATDSVAVQPAANGKPPAFLTSKPAPRMLNLQAKLPGSPPVSATVNNLSADSVYYFTLIPYTYNGHSDSTYHYLTKDARTVSSKPAGCSGALRAKIAPSGGTPLLPAITVSPNPSRQHFTLKIPGGASVKAVRLQVSDAAGTVRHTANISEKGSYTFGQQLLPGVYFVILQMNDATYRFRVVKE